MPVKFHEALVLQDFLAARLGANPLEHRDPAHRALTGVEGVARASGGSMYLEALMSVRPLAPKPACSREELLAYDRDLAEVTDGLNHARTEPIRWLYFQWVALMFTAIYLDAYLSDPVRLREDLNARLAGFNTKRRLKLPEYALEDLSRLAFWQATGSGKTLQLHANLRQHQLYAARHDAPRPQHTLLLVPNASLASQHLAEFELSGIAAELYDPGPQQRLGTGGGVQILTITSLHDPRDPKARDTEGKWRPSRFGKKNLVLVDEGHRGAADKDGVWSAIRRALAADGFTFEYSATFREVIKGGVQALELSAPTTTDAEPSSDRGTVAREYARSIAVDYAFRRFHKDRYGKHYRVLKLKQEADTARQEMDAYLTGALLAFFEQLLVYESHNALATEYAIERPLLVFAGLRVEGKGDIFNVLKLLGRFLTEPAHFKPILQNLAAGRAEVLTRSGGDVFGGMFGEVRRAFTGPIEHLYLAMVRTIFLSSHAAPIGAARLKEADGEIQLRVGQNPPFGVINVGKPKDVLDELKDQGAWARVEPELSGASLFAELPKRDCRTTILVGSKKFMEGWNCFRVSMLGVMNIGQGEGTQIIQLFGRGVRLRGKSGSLKRTSDDVRRDDAGTDAERLRVLETLSLFTVNARYLDEFDRQVQEATEDEDPEFPFPIPIAIIGDKSAPHLRVLRFPKRERFERECVVELGPAARPAADGKAPSFEVSLDYYPRAAVTRAEGAVGNEVRTGQNVERSPLPGFALLDHDALHAACARLRNEKRWVNLKLPRAVVVGGARVPLTRWMFDQPNWLAVAMDRRQVDPSLMADLHHRPLWQRLAGELVREFTARWYDYYLRAWQTKHAEIRWWDELPESEQAQLVPEGQFTPDGARHVVTVPVKNLETAELDPVVMFVRDIAAEVSSGRYGVGKQHGMRSIGIPRGLYQPLLALEDVPPVAIRTAPVALNDGEAAFVDAVNAYVARSPPALIDAELHLLRNESRRGLGFFVGQGFYPDFILWIVKGGKQWVIFVDPKGAVHAATKATAAKFRLYKTLWEIEARNALPDVRLDAFIVIQTPEAALDEEVLRSLGGAAPRYVFAHPTPNVALIVERALTRE